MGWSIGYDEKWQRHIGYGVPAYCDHPDCTEEIDRRLAYVCREETPYGGGGCGLYFCEKHLDWADGCERCAEQAKPFTPKPEHPDWLNHVLWDESWAKWRAENPAKVKAYRKELAAAAESGRQS